MFDTVYLSQTSYDNFVMESKGENNFREHNPAHAPYVRISKILSQYKTPAISSLHVVNSNKPDISSPLSLIGELDFADMHFEIYEGNGGHVNGEIVLSCPAHKIIFTGDIIVNPSGFTKEQAEFNLIAPYLMTSVNMDSQKASASRKAVMNLIGGQDWLICGGHGAFFRSAD
jgi:glyoxylase-like metal-dependent hydrolase (beta-lactamase superfamily II)